LKCQICNAIVAVYPEGLEGEKICSNCGLVIDHTPTLNGYTQWTPEWFSNWNEQDSETLKEWLTTLRAVSCQLNIPNYPYREEAARTIRNQNHLLFKSQKLSKNKRATVAALMHLTLKEYNKMRPIKEISKQLSLEPKTVMKQTWLLNKILNEKKKPLKTQRKSAIDYLHESVGKLTHNRDIIINAENTLEQIKRIGGNPIGIAAGAFYYTCKNFKVKISKEKIGEAFHISKRTVYTNEARIRKLNEKQPNKSLLRSLIDERVFFASESAPLPLEPIHLY
jgi:transcription initiation factor TFIIIB Brf1 subunit/transcription initiation factor TFIIB